jgi:predicted DNA-binding transcriptional regulator YafY
MNIKIKRQEIIDKILRTIGNGVSIKKIKEEFLLKNVNASEINDITIRRDLQELGEYDIKEKKYKLISKKRIKSEWYFKYKDPSYSAFPLAVDANDILVLNEAYRSLMQKKATKVASSMLDVILNLQRRAKLEFEHQQDIILFDNAPESIGTEWIEPILNAIKEKKVIKITYQAFGKPKSSNVIHPYFLKEYNRRWYVIGLSKIAQQTAVVPTDNEKVNNYALDRIKSVEEFSLYKFIENPNHKYAEYYKNILGVTINEKENVQTIKFKILSMRANYVTTRKLHDSQIHIKTLKNGDTFFTISVTPNNEMYNTFLFFGKDIEIISPKYIREKMKEILESAIKNYK